MTPTRRQFLSAAAGLALVPALPRLARAASPALTVASRQLEVLGRAATVYGITGPDGTSGIFAREGDRFQGPVRNDSGTDLILHYHGQVLYKNTDDRTRPDGGFQPTGTEEAYDFPLTPGTHWMHSHTLTEQQLLAAAMVTREADAPEMPEAVMMLHDFAFRPPAEIAQELLTSKAHHMAGTDTTGGSMPGMDMKGMDMKGMDMSHMDMSHTPTATGAMPGMAMPAMIHANDVTYDAYLANDRTLADPQVIEVAPGPFRLRVINGATATAFWLSPGALGAKIVAVDGNPVTPVSQPLLPLAQGQRIDLILTIPPEGGAFPILAQVEKSRARTGLILATKGAPITKLADAAEDEAPYVDLSLESTLAALNPLPVKPANGMLHIALGQGDNYRWTINGAAHGEAPPLEAALGSRVELMFMNPTMMMHPMHLHGHHFQVVDIGQGRFNGPKRDTVIVPPGGMVTVAVDFTNPGGWFLHCHHLYHMANGMMTSITVA